MPNKTRKNRARELLERLEKGPQGMSVTERERAVYRLWVTTWVLPELVHLVPELKNAVHSPVCTSEPYQTLKTLSSIK